MNKPFTAKEMQTFFDVVEHKPRTKRQIRIERKKQDKEKYLGGMRLQAVWEEE